MFNKVVLVGNLTRDIELRYAGSGTAIGGTGIAVSRKFTSANGEKREETCFIDITFFGKQAEIANQYLRKGSKLLIEGRLRLEQWQDQNGQNRSKHSISVESMEMLGGGTQQGGYNQNNQGFSQNYESGGTQTAVQQPKTNQVAKPIQPKKQNEYQEDNIPEIDVNTYDEDETIPF